MMTSWPIVCLEMGVAWLRPSECGGKQDGNEEGCNWQAGIGLGEGRGGAREWRMARKSRPSRLSKLTTDHDEGEPHAAQRRSNRSTNPLRLQKMANEKSAAPKSMVRPLDGSGTMLVGVTVIEISPLALGKLLMVVDPGPLPSKLKHVLFPVGSVVGIRVPPVPVRGVVAADGVVTGQDHHRTVIWAAGAFPCRAQFSVVVSKWSYPTKSDFTSTPCPSPNGSDRCSLHLPIFRQPHAGDTSSWGHHTQFECSKLGSGFWHRKIRPRFCSGVAKSPDGWSLCSGP